MDDDYFNGTIAAELLMNSATGAGPGIRTFSAIEIGILKDIGYTAIIPVPAAIWLLGSALLALFGIGRYRTNSKA